MKKSLTVHFLFLGSFLAAVTVEREGEERGSEIRNVHSDSVRIA